MAYRNSTEISWSLRIVVANDRRIDHSLLLFGTGSDCWGWLSKGKRERIDDSNSRFQEQPGTECSAMTYNLSYSAACSSPENECSSRWPLESVMVEVHSEGSRTRSACWDIWKSRFTGSTWGESEQKHQPKASIQQWMVKCAIRVICICLWELGIFKLQSVFLSPAVNN